MAPQQHQTLLCLHCTRFQKILHVARGANRAPDPHPRTDFLFFWHSHINKTPTPNTYTSQKMAAALVIKNGSVFPCTPVSLSITRDPDRETNYALFLPPQELVFNRNGAEAVSSFLVRIDLPLWMGCVKLQPNWVDGPLGGGPFLIRFIDILPDGSEGAVIETYFDAHLSSTPYATSLRLQPEAGTVVFTAEIDPFVGCKFVAVLADPIQLTQSTGFEICQGLSLCQLERVCGRGAMCPIATALTSTPTPVPDQGDSGTTPDEGDPGTTPDEGDPGTTPDEGDTTPDLVLTNVVSSAPTLWMVGAEIEYIVKVCNNGTGDALDILLTSDPDFDNTEDQNIILTSSSFTLARNECKSAHYTYVLTQSDVDAESVERLVGLAAANHESLTVTTTEFAAPDITITSQAIALPDVWEVGAVIQYEAVVCNDGNLDALQVQVNYSDYGDRLVAISDPSGIMSGPITLAAKTCTTVRYNYMLDTKDAESDKVELKLSVDSDYGTVVDLSDWVWKVGPDLEIDMGIIALPDAWEVGAVIQYKAVICNYGNRVALNVNLTSALNFEFFNDSTHILTPESFTLGTSSCKSARYTYVLTQTDLDRGSVEQSVVVQSDHHDAVTATTSYTP